MAVPHPGEMVPSIQVGLLGKICFKSLMQGSLCHMEGNGSFKAMRRSPGNCGSSLGFSVIMQILRKEP